MKTLTQRLAGKYVISETGCWDWIGAKTSNGYGQVWTPERRLMAHRVSYEVYVGPIPESYVVDHLCKNKGCINPAHLEAVTNRTNVMRGEPNVATINAAKEYCDSGHEFTDANTYWRTPSKGDKSRKSHRVCRECANRRSREYKRAKRSRK